MKKFTQHKGTKQIHSHTNTLHKTHMQRDNKKSLSSPPLSQLPLSYGIQTHANSIQREHVQHAVWILAAFKASPEQLDSAWERVQWSPLALCVCVPHILYTQAFSKHTHTHTHIWSWLTTNPEQITDPQSISTSTRGWLNTTERARGRERNMLYIFLLTLSPCWSITSRFM